MGRPDGQLVPGHELQDIQRNIDRSHDALRDRRKGHILYRPLGDYEHYVLLSREVRLRIRRERLQRELGIRYIESHIQSDLYRSVGDDPELDGSIYRYIYHGGLGCAGRRWRIRRWIRRQDEGRYISDLRDRT